MAVLLVKSLPSSHEVTVLSTHTPSNSQLGREYTDSSPDLVAFGKRIQTIVANKKGKSGYKRVLLEYLLDECFSLLP